MRIFAHFMKGKYTNDLHKWIVQYLFIGRRSNSFEWSNVKHFIVRSFEWNLTYDKNVYENMTIRIFSYMYAAILNT